MYKVIEETVPPTTMLDGKLFDTPEEAAQAYYNAEPDSRAMIDVVDEAGNHVEVDWSQIDTAGKK